MTSVFKSGLLNGQHAIITGAGSGINKRIAERFASQGAAISIIGRNQEKCQAAAEVIRAQGGKAAGFSADVRSFEALADAFELAIEQFGPADICIAGAAGNFVAEAGTMSAKAFRTVIEIDLLGTYNTFRAVLPLLRTGGGNLLAISAVQASMPTAAQSHVCSAKAGIEMLIRTLSIEWASKGIRCNAISPGPVADTEGMVRLAPDGNSSWDRLLATIPMGRAADRDEIADLALFLCSGAASYINGTSIAIDGGQTNNGSFEFSRMLLDSLSHA
ncbi:short-chain dehydrogenase [Pseudomonas ogarae]|uniref:SDR family oxidoreductase n=1 Tax=Pseudomonas ogarae (strain DSM 112162 / CECT 30235 / F113) TaxID=1114970 RepID=UPI0009A2EE1A|nr:SDR family oxidoreductase [Pseudomonas ogarae]OPG72102.1 short-chain dehydrogenase [Pseudomonas ogarae]